MIEIELLKTARALIASQPSVPRGVLARDRRGESCEVYGPNGVRFCSEGALLHCSGIGMSTRIVYPAVRRLNRLARQLGYRDVASLNDGAGRPKVLQVYDAAIAELEAAS